MTQDNPPSTGAPWHDVAALADLSTTIPYRTDVEDKPVILFQQENGQIRALAAECPHKGAPLEKGVVCGDQLVCPWHKAIFSIEDGRLLEPLSLDPLAVYPTEVRDGRVWLSLATRPFPAEKPQEQAESVLIIGAGAAGATAAVSLREFSFAGSITMVDSETTAPYDRTALTKTVLSGKAKNDVPPLLRPDSFWTEHDIHRLVGKVVAFDAPSRTVTLADGQTLTADHVLLAPGATPRWLDIPGIDLRGVFTLRQAADAQRLLEACPPHGRVVISGGSFIGMEAAASLKSRGMQVTVVVPDDIPFAKVFGREIGARLRRLHEEKGVTYLAGRRIVGVEGAEHVHGVRLDDGGIDVDDSMRTTAAGVYVAGDCARITRSDSRVRIEHWCSAQVQGRQVARTITGQAGPSHFLPWFWTQQFDCKLEYAGYHEPFDDVVIEGDLENFDFVARLMREGRCVGEVTAGRPDVTAKAVQSGSLD